MGKSYLYAEVPQFQYQNVESRYQTFDWHTSQFVSYSVDPSNTDHLTEGKDQDNKDPAAEAGTEVTPTDAPADTPADTPSEPAAEASTDAPVEEPASSPENSDPAESAGTYLKVHMNKCIFHDIKGCIRCMGCTHSVTGSTDASSPPAETADAPDAGQAEAKDEGTDAPTGDESPANADGEVEPEKAAEETAQEPTAENTEPEKTEEAAPAEDSSAKPDNNGVFHAH